jgi:hypothetical protein
MIFDQFIEDDNSMYAADNCRFPSQDARGSLKCTMQSFYQENYNTSHINSYP